jgi:hypothetical protein
MAHLAMNFCVKIIAGIVLYSHNISPGWLFFPGQFPFQHLENGT